MITTYNFLHDLAECRDVALVGGKGANLGQLARAGFPVPGGFVVDTRGYTRARDKGNAESRAEIGADCEQVGATLHADCESPDV